MLGVRFVWSKFDEQVLIYHIPKLPNPIGNLESDIFS